MLNIYTVPKDCEYYLELKLGSKKPKKRLYLTGMLENVKNFKFKIVLGRKLRKRRQRRLRV
jgi:hypothetical protein